MYVLSVAVSFLSVAIKGFQHKNVIASALHASPRFLYSIFLTSYLMAAFDVAAVSLIVKGGWPVAFTSGTGAAFGMVASIKLHDYLFRAPQASGSHR